MEERGNKVVSLAKYRQQTQAKQIKDDDERRPSLQVKQALAELLSDAEEAAPIKKTPARKRPTRMAQPMNEVGPIITASTGGAVQNVVGNNNQITQNINTTPKLKVGPPPDSIGAHTALRQRITDLIQEIEEHRRTRFGAKFKYGSVQGIAAGKLGLKRDQWQQIWLWDVSRFPEVIEKLEQARDNTQQGRVNKAAQRHGYKHTRGHLFRQEKEHLAKLEWSDDLARSERRLIMGIASRSDMNDNQFANWVAHLAGLVRRLHGEA